MRLRVIAAAIVVVAIAPAPAGAQATDAIDQRVEQLGPGPFMAGFDSLDALLAQADAAVVATVATPGRLTFIEFDAADGVRKNVMAFSVYGVVVKDVLMAGSTAAALAPGATVDVQLRVGREAARAVRAGRDVVTLGDECLLFLFSDRGTWSLIGWRFQFRRSRAEPPRAELVDHRAPMPAADWFGPGVVQQPDAQTPVMDWSLLLAAVAERVRARISDR